MNRKGRRRTGPANGRRPHDAVAKIAATAGAKEKGSGGRRKGAAEGADGRGGVVRNPAVRRCARGAAEAKKGSARFSTREGKK